MTSENLFERIEKTVGKEKFTAMIQKKYKEYLNKSQSYFNMFALDDIKALKSATGIGLGLLEDEVQETYKAYIKMFDIYKLKNLKDISDIKIKLPEESIQRTYKKYIKKDEYDNLLMLRSLSGVELKLPEDFIQKTYRKLIKENYAYGLKILLHVSGIEVKLPEEFMQKEYNDYIDLTYRHENFKELVTITGVKPSKELVQEKYKKFAKKMDISKLAWLYDTSHVEPSEEVFKLLENLY